MNINPKKTAFASFGIPEQMKETVEKHQKNKHAKVPSQDTYDDQPRVDQDDAEEIGAAPDQESGDVKKQDNPLKNMDPYSILKKIGVELNDDHLHHLLFKGFVVFENVLVVKGPKKDFTASFKTLTGAEYDEVDELLAQEAKNTAMTNEGFETRKSMWLLSYGITHLAGNPLTKPVLKPKSKEVDMPQTARAKRAVLSQLAPGVLNAMISIQSTIQVALNLILNDEEHTYIKKS